MNMNPEQLLINKTLFPILRTQTTSRIGTGVHLRAAFHRPMGGGTDDGFFVEL